MDDFQISKKTILVNQIPSPDEDRDAMLAELAYRMTLIELEVK